MAPSLVLPWRPAPEANVFDVHNFGAAGDGKTLDTAAISQAIVAVSRAGGGTVLFPPGTYASYSIRLRSRVTLLLAPGATVRGAIARAGQDHGFGKTERVGL